MARRRMLDISARLREFRVRGHSVGVPPKRSRHVLREVLDQRP
jgi:hypothetical protein